MKKKKRFRVIIILAVLVGIYITVRVTGMLAFFSIPTHSAEPAVNQGDYIIVSSLVSPKRYDHFVSTADIEKIEKLARLSEEDVAFPEGPDKVEVILSRAECAMLKAQNIPFERRVLDKDKPDEWISRMHAQPWNADHFGPLRIPKDHYFVLGDNRHRANDSRYSGLVPVNDFYGTVISE